MIGAQYGERSIQAHTGEAFLVLVDKTGRYRMTITQERRRGESSWRDRLGEAFGKCVCVWGGGCGKCLSTEASEGIPYQKNAQTSYPRRCSRV